MCVSGNTNDMMTGSKSQIPLPTSGYGGEGPGTESGRARCARCTGSHDKFLSMTDRGGMSSQFRVALNVSQEVGMLDVLL